MVLCGSEDMGDIALLRTSKTPRQSSRLAEKFERHSKRKIDISDDEDALFGKLKGRRKLRDPEVCPKRRNSISPKNKEMKTAVGSPATSDVSDGGCKAELNHQSDKYCHFCQHAKVNMLACGNLGCTHRYCLYCLKSHLDENVDSKGSSSWLNGVWHCPTCRHTCCCSSTDCDRDHRHCKAYRYRQRRADVATKRATAHALVSLSSSRPAGHFHPVCSALDRNWSAAGAGTGAGDSEFPESSAAPATAAAAAAALAWTPTRDLIAPTSDGASSVPPAAVHPEGDQDCPIDRLLRAMACVKPSESRPHPAGGACGPVGETAVAAEGDAKPPEEAVGWLREVDAKAADGYAAAAAAEDEGACREMAAAARRAEQAAPPRRVGSGCSGPIGLEALACTAAEILTR
eukprot:CAMPEP_0172187370 /NCGR_PEP_ID=MMETSP1050-20130122/21308_1 /TAXON_ID=233186 /ORGANISM="Cryptomonas curvata, Strain CCAP979/52" /LENGTH=401 /DNA_ID=CAMNT_0012861701 /DNA_START=170 /DNA_END=1372 /DNA_ORIENTATION=+